jgi:enoyl-CoA hydratase
MATSPARTDRWKALDFGPPPSGEQEPDLPVLVEYTHDDRVAVITLNRPHADNAITTAMGARLTEIVETIAVRPAVRAVILTGAGHRAFSVGSDLRQRKDMTKEDWLRQRQDFDRTLYTVRQLRKPIFTAVNGIAYGGGCELAQSTDFIIASDNAIFGQPEAMLGLAAGGAIRSARRRRTGSAWSTTSLSSRRAHQRRLPARGEDREQLTDGGTGGQAGGPDGQGSRSSKRSPS